MQLPKIGYLNKYKKTPHKISKSLWDLLRCYPMKTKFREIVSMKNGWN